MLKIELPWLTGTRLMERWSMNLDELHQAIFSLHLPVYNSSYEREERVVYKEIPNPDYKKQKWVYDLHLPRFNNLDELDDYIQFMAENYEALPNPDDIKALYKEKGRPYTGTGVDHKKIEIPKPEPYFIEKNILYDFEKLCEDPLFPGLIGTKDIKIIDKLLFKIEDVKEFEAKDGIHSKETLEQEIFSASNQDETTDTDAEDFVRNLRVSYESDTEIKIQEPNRKGKIYNHVSLGFSSNETLEWKAFINILQDSPHIYKLGPSKTFSDVFKKKIPVLEYGRRQKRIRIIKNKLIIFFNKEYKIQLPEDFKLYELCKEKGAGKYKFKFQVSRDDSIKSVYQSEYERYSKKQLIAEIEKLGKEYRDTDDEVFLKRLMTASEIAQTKDFLSEEEIRKMVSPEKEKYVPDQEEKAALADGLSVKK
jgi:hypothetical protein